MECVKCVCVWLGERDRRCGGEWVRGLGLGITNLVGTGGVWDTGLCLSCNCVGSVGRLDGWSGPGSVRVVWCYVCVCCEAG